MTSLALLATATSSAKTANAVQARKDDAAFHHKAVLALLDCEFSRKDISRILGLSLRTIRYYANTTCPAYKKECAQARVRRRLEQIRHVKHGKTPFQVEFHLVDDVTIAGSLGERGRYWLIDEWTNLSTKEKVRHLTSDGVSQAHIAQLLGISRQAVSKHLKVIEETSQIAAG